MIYKAAIDYTRVKNNRKIVEILTNGPNQPMKNLIEPNKKLHLKVRSLLPAAHLNEIRMKENHIQNTRSNCGPSRRTEQAEEISFRAEHESRRNQNCRHQGIRRSFRDW